MFFNKIKEIQARLLAEGYTQIKWVLSEPNENDSQWIERYHVHGDDFKETQLEVNENGELIEYQISNGWARIDSLEGEDVILDFLESEIATIDALIEGKRQIITLFHCRDFKN